MKRPGTSFAAEQHAGDRIRRELIVDLSVWWKRLDSERPLSGKERVQLQNTLSAAKTQLSK